MKDETDASRTSSFILQPFAFPSAGGVETDQPHVANDHDLERFLGVIELVRRLQGLQPPRFQKAKITCPVEDNVI